MKISPKPFIETQSEDEIEFLLKKISSIKKAQEVYNDSVNSTNAGDSSFALPSKLDLPNLSQDNLVNDRPAMFELDVDNGNTGLLLLDVIVALFRLA